MQEQSEIRWLKLIDQARTETIKVTKRLENTISKQKQQIKALQQSKDEVQTLSIKQQLALKQYKAEIGELTAQKDNLQSKYNGTLSQVAVLDAKLEIAKKLGKKTRKRESVV